MEGRIRVRATIFILCSIFLPLASNARHPLASGARHRHKHGRVARHGFGGVTQLKDLRVGFYGDTCPQVEQIVNEVVTKAYKKDPGVVAGFLRLFFHDCFVHGCDASILLDKTASGEKVEKDSRANGQGMRGLEVIDEAKARIEAECPGIVSCADVLSYATREGSVIAGVPHYDVAAGRRDGLISRETDVAGNIPLPSQPLQNISQLFISKGMTVEDMVVLIGSHSIGIAHCPTFLYRVAQYNPTVKVDPKLTTADANNIRNTCLRPVPFEILSQTFMPFDPVTPFRMDNIFYKHLLEGKALIESDRLMADDITTKQTVQAMAGNEQNWLEKFADAMARLGMVDVKTGTEGEIRTNCRFVNSVNPQQPGDNNGDSGIGFDKDDEKQFREIIGPTIFVH
ncbi:hypothetical protein ACSBR1_036841 [Camellia fascicularis]